MKRKGFTLLEMILVISTILFLLGVLIVVAGSAHLDAQERTTCRVIDALESACVVYYQLNGAYPRRDYHGSATGVLLYDCLTGEESGRAVSSIPDGMIEGGAGQFYFVDSWRNRILYVPFAPQGLTSSPSTSYADESRKWAMNGGVPLIFSYGSDGKGWDFVTMWRNWKAADLRDYLYLKQDRADNQDNITNFRDIPLEYIP